MIREFILYEELKFYCPFGFKTVSCGDYFCGVHSNSLSSMKADDTLQGVLPSIVLVRKTSFIGLFAQASQFGPL